MTNVGHDRTQLFKMATQAKEVLDVERLEVVADRGYFKGEEILACEEAAITTYLPKPQTSGSVKQGLFSKRFIYRPEEDEYECPAGERLIRRFETDDKGQKIHKCWSSSCPTCPIRTQCTRGDYRRISSWEHEEVLEALERRLDKEPERMNVRRQTSEHPFGTLKAWMGSTHFQMRTAKNVGTEMSLHVLAYNLKRAIAIMGVRPLMEAMRT